MPDSQPDQSTSERPTSERPTSGVREDWFVVATVQGDANAAIITGLLGTAGIPTHIYRESAGAAIGITVGPLGLTQVLVPESCYDLALSLLEEDDDENLLDDGALPLDDGDTVESA